jgi:hypothetical protein
MLHKRGIHHIQDYHAAVVAEGENYPTGCLVSVLHCAALHCLMQVAILWGPFVRWAR